MLLDTRYCKSVTNDDEKLFVKIRNPVQKDFYGNL